MSANEAQHLGIQARALSAVPLFQSLEPREVETLAKLLEEISYRGGESVFHENDPGDAMYIVRTGAVRIWTHDEDVHEVTLAVLDPGQFFGELAVLDGSPRSATATAAEDTTLYRLSQKDFHAFMLAHPSVAVEMIREIGARLRQTNQLVSRRVTRNVNEEADKKMTVGERIADRVADFGGSWTFVILFIALILTWVVMNSYLAWQSQDGRAFDPFPFIALNLLLGVVAAFQAPIIMMSQKRAAEKDRLMNENDYKVNLKSEVMLQDLTRRMERLQSDQVEDILAAIRRLNSSDGQDVAATIATTVGNATATGDGSGEIATTATSTTPVRRSETDRPTVK
jgi:uncharacterized membrane protein